MIVAIQGTKNFDDYTIFLRAMGTAIRDLQDEDKQITIMSAGPAKINSFAQEFSNISERGLKGRGIKIKVVKIPPSWIEGNISVVNYLAFFSKPKESLPSVVELAEAKDIPVGVYRY
jgi:hypothetical protein